MTVVPWRIGNGKIKLVELIFPDEPIPTRPFGEEQEYIDPRTEGKIFCGHCQKWTRNLKQHSKGRWHKWHVDQDYLSKLCESIRWLETGR